MSAPDLSTEAAWVIKRDALAAAKLGSDEDAKQVAFTEYLAETRIAYLAKTGSALGM